MKNSIITFILFLLLFNSCLYRRNTNFHSLSEAQRSYMDGEVSKIDTTWYIDTLVTAREMFAEITPEHDLVYQFINERTTGDLSNICSQYQGKTVIMSIIVRDSIIDEAAGMVYEFNNHGNLIFYEEEASEFVNLFLNKDADRLGFIGSYKFAHYIFRIETKRICK